MNVKSWWKSGSQQRQLFADWILCSWPRVKVLLGLFACGVMWIVLALSLTGCAHNSSVPCPEQKLPPAPALSEPTPQTSYFLSVQTLFQKWQEKLIAMPMMQKP